MPDRFLEEGFSSQRLRPYRIVALPCVEMRERILVEKKEFLVTHQQVAGEAGMPQVLLSEFLAKDEMEDTIIRWMQRILSGQPAFAVTVNNYGGCPAQTVFLRIQDPEVFHELTVSLRPIDSYVQGNDCPPVRFVSRPNIPIAEELGEKLYEDVIGYYSRKDFHASFEIRELVLQRHDSDAGAFVKRAVLGLQPSLQNNN